METLLLLCLFPLAWPFIAKRIWDTTINYQEMFLQIVIVTLVTTGVYQAGKWGATHDTEIWNGQVVKKERNHGYYQTSYCCGTDKDGNCTSTCYNDHYTVHWITKTTVGNVTLKSLDRGSRAVYNTPDPIYYTNCKVGEPASLIHSYTNYVQAVPESLFHDDSKSTNQFLGKIPPYPKVHSFYKLNRVLQVDAAVSSQLTSALNKTLNKTLKTLGPSKQVNIIVILTGIQDPTYRYAVERAWLGGEKNDVIVILGIDKTSIKWVDVITWALNSGNELFHVTLRDSLMKLKTVESPKLASTITNTITSTYDRPHMKDYEYLADEVTPASWVIILAVVLSIGGSIGLTFLFHRVEVDFFRNRGYSRRRFFNRRR